MPKLQIELPNGYRGTFEGSAIDFAVVAATLGGLVLLLMVTRTLPAAL